MKRQSVDEIQEFLACFEIVRSRRAHRQRRRDSLTLARQLCMLARRWLKSPRSGLALDVHCPRPAHHPPSPCQLASSSTLPWLGMTRACDSVAFAVAVADVALWDSDGTLTLQRRLQGSAALSDSICSLRGCLSQQMIYAEQRWLETGTRQRVLHISERELNLYCQNANKCATLLMILAGYCYDAYATGYMYDDLDGDLCGHRERACGEVIASTDTSSERQSFLSCLECQLLLQSNLSMLSAERCLPVNPTSAPLTLRILMSGVLQHHLHVLGKLRLETLRKATIHLCFYVGIDSYRLHLCA
eukprot:3728655-Pleurochrysis_carterae.AAC.3